jgi:cold shock protein
VRAAGFIAKGFIVAFCRLTRKRTHQFIEQRVAARFLSVDSSTAQQEPLKRARPERPVYPPTDQAAVEESGTVKWYNAMKGFGFIASDRGGEDIFVHASALERAGITGLTEGQRVAVDVIDGRKGPEATGLRLI